MNYNTNMKQKKSIFNWILFILLSLIPIHASAQTDSIYTLSVKSVTSAGVYQNERLIFEGLYKDFLQNYAEEGKIYYTSNGYKFTKE